MTIYHHDLSSAINILLAHQAISKADSGNLEEKRSFLQKIGSNFHIIGQKAAVELGFPWAAASEKSRFTVWSSIIEDVHTGLVDARA